MGINYAKKFSLGTFIYASYLNVRHFSAEDEEVEIKQSNTENIVSQHIGI